MPSSNYFPIAAVPLHTFKDSVGLASGAAVVDPSSPVGDLLVQTLELGSPMISQVSVQKIEKGGAAEGETPAVDRVSPTTAVPEQSSVLGSYRSKSRSPEATEPTSTFGEGCSPGLDRSSSMATVSMQPSATVRASRSIQSEQPSLHPSTRQLLDRVASAELGREGAALDPSSSQQPAEASASPQPPLAKLEPAAAQSEVLTEDPLASLDASARRDFARKLSATFNVKVGVPDTAGARGRLGQFFFSPWLICFLQSYHARATRRAGFRAAFTEPCATRHPLAFTAVSPYRCSRRTG
jgi:hypothetical protein